MLSDSVSFQAPVIWVNQILRMSLFGNESISMFIFYMYDILFQVVLKGTYGLHSIISPDEEHAKLQEKHMTSAVFIDFH